MKSLFCCGAALLLAFGLNFLSTPMVRAQNSDSVRVVRLSRAEGEVLVMHAGGDAWEEALANLPLQEGDTLATQGGLAEIEFENGATAYLAENSALQFTQLHFADGGKATELTLTQGAGAFYANLASQDFFRVRTLTLDVAISERAQLRVDVFRDGAAVEVFLGTVTVSTAKGFVNLEKGQSVAVHERDFQDLSNIARLPEEDAFDRWVTEEGETIRSGTRATLGYISTPNYYGLSDLSIYGNWVYLAGFGLTWRPFSVGISWTPYVNGVWTFDARLGWIWVSNEAWGWMPYHFGSWLLSPTVGWVWVPGGPAGLQRWEPACVNWVRAGNQVGWVARSPLDRNGAPANLAAGIVTRPSRPPRNPNGSNELVTGKELQRATLLKEPPAEFASRPAPSTLRSGNSALTRRAPEGANNNESIVYDRGTHTFINRDGSRTDNQALVPVPPAALMPQSGTGSVAPRVTIPSTMPAQPPGNRILLPPPYPAAQTSHRTSPASTVPPRAPAVAPNAPQHPAPPPQQPASPSTLQQRPAAPHSATGQLGSAPRPAARPEPPAPSHQ